MSFKLIEPGIELITILCKYKYVFISKLNVFLTFSPPDPAKLQKAREKRLKEIKMNAALKEIFAFFVFLILLMDVAQYHRNPDTFLLTKTLYETFEEVDAYGLDLAAVSIDLPYITM